MNHAYKVGGVLFIVALMASIMTPVFAEEGGLTGTSTKPHFEKEVRMAIIASSTAARLERQEKAKTKTAAAQCLRDATKTANQAYQTAVRKANDDYKTAVMAARKAMLDAKKKAQTDMTAAKLAAKTQCVITTQTSTSTAPTL